MVRHIDSQMSYCATSLVLKVLDQIKLMVIGFQEHCADLSNPTWDCSTEHEGLNVARARCFDSSHDFLNVLFEAKIKHDVSFIEDCEFEIVKFEVSALHMVLNASCGSNEYVDTTSQLCSL